MGTGPMKLLKQTGRMLALALLIIATLPQPSAAQNQDDPPSRVARLGYMQGSVSFQPAGESEWVQAVPNRPMTTGDQLWADQGSRAEVELGYAVIRLGADTGFSFLNLDDHTTQIQLTSGSLNITVRRLDRNDVFEVDTPNQAFTAFRPGHYRLDASEDGNYTVISVREGEGESTGAGQIYSLYSGDRATFRGVESLSVDVVNITAPDEFDNWASNRDRRHDRSRSALYLSHDVVGYEDLDDQGQWRNDANYGHIWFPQQVSAGWAPYREGHWDWISPWGWTWVDDAPWGYAPYHYGRWVAVEGRWGWVPGPANVEPVYAPALVVFIGGGGIRSGGNVGWFPLGPRDVYVPSYNVSRAYVNRVNVSNTTVSTTTVTNVYNTTVINKSTTITNVVYQNKNATGAVTAVPQRAFVTAQPVAKAAVAVNARELASVPVSSRVTVAPSRESVLGSKANSAGHVAAPPPALASRQVIAKASPPPPPVPFVRQQQALAAHPGQPLAKQEEQALRPAGTPAAKMEVKLAPPGKLMPPNAGRPGNPPGNRPPKATPAGQPASAPPAGRPGAQPAPPAHPEPTPPAPSARPEPGRPSEPPARPNGRPEPAPPAPSARPEPGRPSEPPARPNGHPEPAPPAPSARPGRPSEPPARPNARPEPASPAPSARPGRRSEPPARPNARPEPAPPASRPSEAKPRAGSQQKQQPPNKRLTPEEKKNQNDQRKQKEVPQPPQ
jgi:Family of unknown function (DUF6600)